MPPYPTVCPWIAPAHTFISNLQNSKPKIKFLFDEVMWKIGLLFPQRDYLASDFTEHFTRDMNS